MVGSQSSLTTHYSLLKRPRRDFRVSGGGDGRGRYCVRCQAFGSRVDARPLGPLPLSISSPLHHFTTTTPLSVCHRSKGPVSMQNIRVTLSITLLPYHSRHPNDISPIPSAALPPFPSLMFYSTPSSLLAVHQIPASSTESLITY